MNGFPDARYDMTAPPSIYNNLVILTARVQEAPDAGPFGQCARLRPAHWQAGLDLSLHSAARRAEFHDTWAARQLGVKRSGVNVWNMMTLDARRGIVYMAFGAPAIDRFGGDRHGANLFSDAIVAADAANAGMALPSFFTSSSVGGVSRSKSQMS